MDWYPSVLNFNAAGYDERPEQLGLWDGTAEHIVHTMNFKALTDTTLIFFFHYNLNYNE